MRRLFAFATVLLLTAPAWADWDGGDCFQCELTGANFSDANFEGAILSGAFLTTAHLSSANLRDARFCNILMPDGTTLGSGFRACRRIGEAIEELLETKPTGAVH